jgi:hypothetical protein
MPTFRLAAAFLAGGVATAIAVVAMNLGRRSSDDTVHLWGRYWESRMGFDYALMAHKTAHATSQDAQRWADENDRCFQELVDRHILIPVHYDWRSKGETDEFRRVTTTFTTYPQRLFPRRRSMAGGHRVHR